MYIIHFKKYKNGYLIDSWTSIDYFHTDFQAEKWLLFYDDPFKKDEESSSANSYICVEDKVTIKATIVMLHEFLG